MKKKVKRFCKVFACALSIFIVMCVGFVVSADETITDLTGTTWTWNYDDLPYFGGEGMQISKSVTFTSNGQTFTEMRFFSSGPADDGENEVIYFAYPGGETEVWFQEYDVQLIALEDYQTFTISGGSHVDDATLIEFITSNATHVVPEPPAPPAPSLFGTIGTFLSSCLAWLGSVVETITGNAVLTIFCLGIAVISFSIGVLRRLLNMRG